MKMSFIIHKLLKYLKNPRRLYIRFATKKLNKISRELTDEEYLKRLYKICFGKKLNLASPRTFNEKMHWLKLFNRNAKYTIMVDKNAAKKYVSDILGEQFVAKKYGCWKKYEDVDFKHLPNQFVLKTTHGCGGMLVCKNKETLDFLKYKKQFESTLDFLKYKKQFESSLNDNYYYHCREWPYKNVEPQIIAEELLFDGQHENLPVYKFFCFSGEPFLAQVIQNDKHINETIDYVDMQWNILKIKQNYPNSKKPLPKPECLDKAIEICRLLTKDIPFVRCDLYIIKNQIYFSEFTFYSDAGFERFHPNKWDLILGELIKLDSKNDNL